MERTPINTNTPQPQSPSITWTPHPYRSCVTCDFGGTLQTPGARIHICRKHPPRPFLNMIMSPQGPAFAQNETWPRVAPNDWCGQWLPLPPDRSQLQPQATKTDEGNQA